MGCDASVPVSSLMLSYALAGGIPALVAGREGHCRKGSLGIPIPRRRGTTGASRSTHHGEERSSLGYAYSEHSHASTPSARYAPRWKSQLRTESQEAKPRAAERGREEQERPKACLPTTAPCQCKQTRRHSSYASRRHSTVRRFQQWEMQYQGDIMPKGSAHVFQGTEERQTLWNVLPRCKGLPQPLMGLQ